MKKIAGFGFRESFNLKGRGRDTQCAISTYNQLRPLSTD